MAKKVPDADVEDCQVLVVLKREAVYALQTLRRIRRMLKAGCLQVTDDEAHPDFYRTLLVECQGLRAAIEEGEPSQET